MIADPVLARLACDSTLVGMAHAPDGSPIGVGRRTRTIPGWLRRMLYQRDPGCMFVGCPNDRWTDAHHILHWTRDGGPTELGNLVRLCRFHHGRVHDLGLTIAQSIPDRMRTFHRPDGTTIHPSVLPGGSADHLTDGTEVQAWEGDPARLSLIVDALVEATDDQEAQADVAAETSDIEPLDSVVTDQPLLPTSRFEPREAIKRLHPV